MDFNLAIVIFWDIKYYSPKVHAIQGVNFKHYICAEVIGLRLF